MLHLAHISALCCQETKHAFAYTTFVHFVLLLHHPLVWWLGMIVFKSFRIQTIFSCIWPCVRSLHLYILASGHYVWLLTLNLMVYDSFLSSFSCIWPCVRCLHLLSYLGVWPLRVASFLNNSILCGVQKHLYAVPFWKCWWIHD